jgi:hypothetical protein
MCSFRSNLALQGTRRKRRAPEFRRWASRNIIERAQDSEVLDMLITFIKASLENAR